jgi:phage-related protein
MIHFLKPIPLRFWKSHSGKEPVRIWLSQLSADDKKVIGYDLAKLQFGWPLGLPLCRFLRSNLWEVRSSLPSRCEARVIFTFYQGSMIALHAFIKKTQKIPTEELDIALQRLKDLDP